jgi:hypothetical protein
MKVNTIRFRLFWTSLGAIACFAVLAAVDLKLKAESGYGAVDLQKSASPGALQTVIAAWGSPRHAAMAGFGLGFDYLFMPLYGFAFYYGALVARDAFLPNSIVLRRLLTLLAAVPLAGAIFDAAENTLELTMLFNAPTGQLALYAYSATMAKFICFYIGLVLWLLGLAGLMRRSPEAKGQT